jgi:HTH-type transcriptional regulator/antitoxin HigA
MSETLQSARAVAPGEIIELELDARGWSQRDLAEIMDRPPQAISEIIRGVKQITPETALELAQSFGTSPELWINLEASYRLQQVRQRRDRNDSGIAIRSRLYAILPIADMLRRGWLSAGQATEDLEQAVYSFLGGDPEQVVSAVSFRHSVDRGPEHGAQVAWVCRARQLARAQVTAPYDRERLAQALPDLQRLMLQPEDVAGVPLWLKSFGIRFVVVPQLPKTYIDGALCNSEDAPIIALTLRYDRIDSFWFTLMHELAHLVLGHRTLHLDNWDNQEQQRDEQEVTANAKARSWLLDQSALNTWVVHTKPYFARRAIESFATTQRVHPGIVLGQLMFDGTVGYKHLRGLLVKVSPYLTDWIDGSGVLA